MKFDNDKPCVTVSRAELEALMLCASSDEARVNLYTLHIDPAMRSLVTTNGYLLFVGTEVGHGREATGEHSYRTTTVALPAAPGPAICLSAKHVAKWLRFATGKEEIAIAWDAKEAKATIAEQTLAVAVSTHTFPPWRDALAKPPTEKKAVAARVGFFSEIVITALTALHKVSPQKSAPIVWNFTDHVEGESVPAANPITLTTGGDDSHWRAIVMPMRPHTYDLSIDPYATAFPTWKPKKSEPEATPEAAEEGPSKTKKTRTPSKPKKRTKKPFAKKKRSRR